MEKITLYSTSCPKCGVLKRKLDERRIEYETVAGAQAILDLGYTSAPLLKVGDEVMVFGKAIEWLSKEG